MIQKTLKNSRRGEDGHHPRGRQCAWVGRRDGGVEGPALEAQATIILAIIHNCRPALGTFCDRLNPNTGPNLSQIARDESSNLCN